jgi:hypothetical protein
VGDDEEVLAYGPRRPRRLWVAALVVAAVALGVLIAVRTWPHSAPHGKTVAAPTSSPPPSARTTQPPQPGPPVWPTAPAACGGDAQLPIVSSAAVTAPTGLRLLVGGSPLRTVDFDSGRAAEVTGLIRGTFVTELDTASPGYAVTNACDPSVPSRVARLTSDVHIGAQRGIGPVAEFVALDGPRVWAFTSPDAAHPHGTVRLDGGRPVRLPSGLFPEAITDGVVVGARPPSAGNGPGSIQLVDAANGRVRQQLGPGQVVAVGGGTVVWSQGCYLSISRPCPVHRRSVDGGSTATFRLPRSPGFTYGVVSADGRRLAFTLTRPRREHRYRVDHPMPPSDVAILDFGTGALHVVPGVELAPKDPPGLAFTPDGRWLVLALNAGTKTRLLAWRPGLARPLETAPVAGPAWSPPAVAALASRSGS